MTAAAAALLLLSSSAAAAATGSRGGYTTSTTARGVRRAEWSGARAATLRAFSPRAPPRSPPLRHNILYALRTIYIYCGARALACVYDDSLRWLYGLGTAEGGAARGGRVRRRRPPPRSAPPGARRRRRRGERLLCKARPNSAAAAAGPANELTTSNDSDGEMGTRVTLARRTTRYIAII